MGGYDAIVVGLGAMGSATAYQLSRRGWRVLGLEAFAPGHRLGSSHGESRIIRTAYFEHPSYVPLLRRAYQLWRELEGEAGAELLRITGGLFIGPPEGALVGGSRRSAELHGLPHELLDAAAIRGRYPVLRADEGEVGLFEHEAGILFPERCIEAHLRLAAAGGAELRHQEPVRAWRVRGEGVEVATDAGRYTAGRLVLTAGAWLGKLLGDLELPLQPERIPIFWFQPVQQAGLFESDRLPIYIWETPDLGFLYGFPHLGLPGAKAGRHHSGVDCDPDTLERTATAAEEARVRELLARCIPALNGPVVGESVCIYTNTPDEHFLVDRHPRHPAVVFAGGFSGHGFKFAPVIGEILADLAEHGRATTEADFLRVARLAAAGGRRTTGQ